MSKEVKENSVQKDNKNKEKEYLKPKELVTLLIIL
jgi:hypothetical protein